MFMVVGFPFPVASAHVDLTGPNKAAATRQDLRSPGATGERETPNAEKLVSWSAAERLRFCWYQLRLRANGIGGASGRASEPRSRVQ
jgi:hypothetical protein